MRRLKIRKPLSWIDMPAQIHDELWYNLWHRMFLVPGFIGEVETDLRWVVIRPRSYPIKVRK